MHDVRINEWFIINNDNIDIKWRCLNMINLDMKDEDIAMKHAMPNNSTYDDDSEPMHCEIALKKSKLMHNVRIYDWFVMNSDNIDFEWRCLNMINLDMKDDDIAPKRAQSSNTLTMDTDNIDMEWKRLNKINFDSDTHGIDYGQ